MMKRVSLELWEDFLDFLWGSPFMIHCVASLSWSHAFFEK